MAEGSDIEGCQRFLERYIKAMPVEKAAISAM